jgi:nanoRNase/pAp phosphatase (c-di-AMP/oligoRNAs hydrolase)
MSSDSQKYRLVTRSDFDGLVSAVLLNELGLIREIKFVHPKDMQDGTIEITNQDITTNLPYVAGAHLVFDHHASEASRNGTVRPDNYILSPEAPSAARVVYEYYGGKQKFLAIDDAMLKAVDKSDSAQFELEEVLYPKGWELLSFIMDARTGLGRFRDFRISNYQLMMDLIGYCREHSISEILELPDIKERTTIYFEQEKNFKEQLERCLSVYDNLGVIDLRNEETIFASNRFMVYALHPEINISIHVLWGLQRQNTVFAVGKSIFNKTSNTDIGTLMLKHGGGGHRAAGTCQVPHANADAVLQELIDQIRTDG